MIVHIPELTALAQAIAGFGHSFFWGCVVLGVLRLLSR
jgi:hypothetical protein